MKRQRALVLGGSMAGMLAARVLADHCDVTIVERDELPEGAVPRRGLPQAMHLHAVLSRGQSLLEGWFPGLREELIRDGAVEADAGTELGWLSPFGWAASFERGQIANVWLTRDFLDAHLRARLRRDARVGWLEGCQVDELVLDKSRRRVLGVRTTAGEVHEADLVVDATGRGSRLPKWLRESGLAAPDEVEVDSGLTYSSALLRLARPMPNGWKAVLVHAAAPHVLAAGFLSQVDGGRAMVTLSGQGGLPMPEEPQAALEFARRLRSPVVAELLEGAEWLSPLRITRATVNQRRHYERIQLPAGVLPLGDSFCAFNPIYAQGITVAALEADALSTLLRTNAPGDPVLPARAARAFARIIGFPWLAATGDDFRFATTRGRRPPGLRLAHAYLDRLFSASGRDPRVWLQVARVLQFSDSPLSLYSPRMLWAALRQPRPQALIGPVALPLALASAVGQAHVHYPREHAVPRD